MKTILFRILGFLLVIIALAGVLFCALGVLTVWRTKDTATKEILSNVDFLVEALDAGEQGIVSVSASLDTAATSIDNLDKSIQTARSTLESTEHFFDTAAELTGKTLPDVLTSVQKSFESASQSAQIVDDTLNVVAALPLIGAKYTPEVPLSEALKKVATELSPLPGTFEGMQDDVVQVKGDMGLFQAQLDDAHKDIAQIQGSVSSAKEVTVKYQQMINDISERLKALRDKTPRGLNLLAWGLSIFLAWFGLSQLGLFVQGINLMLTPFPAQPPKVAPQPESPTTQDTPTSTASDFNESKLPDA